MNRTLKNFTKNGRMHSLCALYGMTVNKIGISFVLCTCTLMLAFLTGCSSQSTSTIEIPGDVTASISINGKHVQVRDGILTYDGQKIAVPENATLKITHTGTARIYIDDKLALKEP